MSDTEKPITRRTSRPISTVQRELNKRAAKSGRSTRRPYLVHDAENPTPPPSTSTTSPDFLAIAKSTNSWVLDSSGNWSRLSPEGGERRNAQEELMERHQTLAATALPQANG